MSRLLKSDRIIIMQFLKHILIFITIYFIKELYNIINFLLYKTYINHI